MREERDMTRANERGSVVGFVVVGLLLTAMVVGGIYGVRHYITGTSNDAEVATTSAPADEAARQSEEQRTKEDSQKNEAEKKQQAEADQKKAEAEKQAAAQRAEQKKAEKEQQQAAEEHAASDSQSDASETTPASEPSHSETLPQTGVDALPQTGPAETAISAVAIASLLGAALVYRRSQQL